MAHKVMAVSAGEAHTLALTGDGSVFSWGRGTFGRLGTGKEADELCPVPVRFAWAENSLRSGSGERGKPCFVAIAAGAYHSLALQDDGSVWSWGYNIYGQLGQGEENSLLPRLVEAFLDLGPRPSLDERTASHEKKPLKVSSVKAGGMMSLAIDSLGGLWMWGNCPQQSTSSDSSGEFSLASSYVPLPVWEFHGHTVVKVACGNEHIVALVTVGETNTGGDLLCYSWGNNHHGQLGLGDCESRARPQNMSTFDHESPWSVYEIACGAFHTAILTQRRFGDGEEIGCKCWTFGLGDNGQLGHGTADNRCLPEPVDALPRDAILISVDCGLFHTSVVSVEGDVWSWGMEKGLGLCPDARFGGNNAGDALSPLRIRPGEPGGGGDKFPGPGQVACGAAHTVVVAGDGYQLWAWGRGRSGVLGRGHLADSFVPCAVMWPPSPSPPPPHAEDYRAAAAAAAQDGHGGERRSDRHIRHTSAAAEDVKQLQTKLAILQRYAGVLHASVFGTVLEERHLPPRSSVQDADVLDLRKELEERIELAEYDELGRMEAFYRNMLTRVKERRMKVRIEEMVRESFSSLSSRSQSPSRQQHIPGGSDARSHASR